MDWMGEATKIAARLTEYRRHFHANPEPSGKEWETAAFIAARLRELGYTVRTDVGAPMPGIVAVLTGNSLGRTVALRADMDALLLTEANDVSYRSRRDGVMHACGHDAHMAILLGAAELLARQAANLEGTVKLIFQPSEEAGKEGGALPMIRDGALAEPAVDAIFGLHVDPEYPAGDVVVAFGQTMAASDNIILRIVGESGHAAMPHLAVDAVVVAAHVIIAMQTAMTRVKDARDAAVLSFGKLEGGTKENIIAEAVRLEGILRTLDPTVREQLMITLKGVAAGVANSFGATSEFYRTEIYDALVNDEALSTLVQVTARELCGATRVQRLARPKMGTEDFANYLRYTPGAFYFLGCAPTGVCAPSLHNSRFMVDESILPVGAALQAALAFRYLKEGAISRGE